MINCMKLMPERAYELLSPRIVVLITTVDNFGGINAAPVSFISPMSFNPAIVMISLRPIRHTYQNIITKKEFVINILGKIYAYQVLRCAARYPEGINKLAQVGLRWYSSEKVEPPRVKEAKAWIECKFLEEKRIGDHMMIFGQVVAVEVDDRAMRGDEIDFEKINPLMHMVNDEFGVDFKVVKYKRYD